jgi:hypothetical protein
MKNAFPLAAALLLGAPAAPISSAWAGSVTGTLPITIQAPLAVVFTPAEGMIACNAPAGAVVSAISVTGGDGNPATFTASGGDTSDFAVSGSNVVVGANGIAAAHCGQTLNVTVGASQP